MQGMYIHTHWGYNRPYAARSWTLTDWEGYLEGLARLGYDTVKIWPQIDTMPLALTRSDEDYLKTLAQAIGVAHRRFGQKVILVLTANCMGNTHAASYEFARRPYFVCEQKVNPADEGEVAVLLAQRSNALRFTPEADAIAIIDSDPGGYIGSTNAEFASLCVQQAQVFRQFNPAGEFVYWMLTGWETYCRFWAAQRDASDANPDPWQYHTPADFDETLALLQAHLPAPWWMTGWLPQHKQAAARAGLSERILYYPYGLIEGEPYFPLTLVDRSMAKTLAPETLRSFPMGVMGNAQTHCLQLPHTFWFAHLAQGGSLASSASLEDFAGRLIPAAGGELAAAWQALELSGGEDLLRAAACLRQAAGGSPVAGDLGGLLFGDPRRFLIDLALNLELRAALLDFGQALPSVAAQPAEGRSVRSHLAAVLDRFRPYQQRVGFVDAYYGPLATLLNQPLSKLGDPGLDAVLHDFDDWRHPAVRNGIVLRLIAAIERYLAYPPPAQPER